MRRAGRARRRILHRLIALGHRVAVCEQLEDPAEARKRGSKSVVHRDVVRLVTAGTLTEDSLLDARRNNYLLAVARARLSSAGEDARFALAWIDIRPGIPRHRMRTGFALRRDRKARAGRDHRLRCAVQRGRSRGLLALSAGGDAGHARRVRWGDRRAAAGILLCGGNQRSVRAAHAAGA